MIEGDEGVGAEVLAGQAQDLAIHLPGRQLPLALRIACLAGGCGTERDRLAEPQLGGAAKERARLLGREPGKLHGDVAVPLAGDLRLGHTGAIHTTAQHPDRAIEGRVEVAIELLGDVGAQEQARAALEVQPQAHVVAHEVADGHTLALGPRDAGREEVVWLRGPHDVQRGGREHDDPGQG